MKTQTEPFTKKQQKELQEAIAPSTAIFRSILFIIPVYLIGRLFYFIQRNLFPSNPPYWLIPAIAFGTFLYVRAGKWTGGRKFRKEIKKDLKNGVCNHHLVEPVDVIEFEEQEDEGPSYLIQTTDNQTIFMSGQYLESYKCRKFPWGKFAIQEAPSSRVSFGLKRLGDPIPVTELRPSLEYSILKQIGALNRDYVVLNTQEEELLNLKRG